MKVAVIGAGLAGCAAGYFLEQSGADVILYDASDFIPSGASGNNLGMYNPRFSAFETPESLFYGYCFEQAVSLFSAFAGIDWHPCGALHLITDEKRDKRYRQTAKNWSLGGLGIVDAKQASAIAGVDVPFSCLYLSNSGSVSPKTLCVVMSEGLDVQLGVRIESLDAIDADAIIVANGMGAVPLLHLPLKAVRGQITEVQGHDVSRDLRVNLHYGGYLSASKDGQHTIGATFQRWLDHTDVLDEDDAYNIEKLCQVLPDLGRDLIVKDRRASMRTTSPDHFPVIGHVRDNVYVSTAHGSHGIITSIGGGQLLADMIMGRGVRFSDETMKALCPKRFKNAKTAA